MQGNQRRLRVSRELVTAKVDSEGPEVKVVSTELAAAKVVFIEPAAAGKDVAVREVAAAREGGIGKVLFGVLVAGVEAEEELVTGELAEAEEGRSEDGEEGQ